MVINPAQNIIQITDSIKEALLKLNSLDKLILFVVDGQRLVGTLTDGDIRRGLMKSLTVEHLVSDFMNSNFRYLKNTNIDFQYIENLRKDNINIIPIIDDKGKILHLVDFSHTRSILPVDVVIMAGGKGERLKPLTDTCPKPLLKVGDKPILEHNVDRLIGFGVFKMYISVNYLADQIEDYFSDGSSKGISINYLKESKPLGTFGAISLVDSFVYDHVLILNSDLLTNIDFEDFFKAYLLSGADMAIAAIPYNVNVPYAVLETVDEKVISFKEKPTYTYYSNAGIYLLGKSLLSDLKPDHFYNATDFMESLITSGKKVINYPLLGYWLDIGKHEDFKKAQEDVKHIKF
jgi:dTDP-glucose pyrophosphorylase